MESSNRSVCIRQNYDIMQPIVLLFLLLLTTISSSSSTTSTAEGRRTKETKMVLYQHYSGSGAHMSAYTVAGIAGPKKWTGFEFGTIAVGDNPLTEGIDRESSKEVGRAQGLFVTATRDGSGAHLSYSVVFTAGRYNGSTLEIAGRDNLRPLTEVAVVGGTGVFRYARGYALVETASVEKGTLNNVILKMSFAVRHPHLPPSEFY